MCILKNTDDNSHEIDSGSFSTFFYEKHKCPQTLSLAYGRHSTCTSPVVFHSGAPFGDTWAPEVKYTYRKSTQSTPTSAKSIEALMVITHRDVFTLALAKFEIEYSLPLCQCRNAVTAHSHWHVMFDLALRCVNNSTVRSENVYIKITSQLKRDHQRNCPFQVYLPKLSTYNTMPSFHTGRRDLEKGHFC